MYCFEDGTIAGWVCQDPYHLKDLACPIDPNMMSWLCGELYYVTCRGHVNWDE